MKTQPPDLPKRYAPALVALHWIMAVLILMMLAVGRLVFPSLSGDAAAESSAVRVHMYLGMLLLILVIVRFVIRVRTPKPAPASIGNAFLDKVGVVTHYLLYFFIFQMAMSGVGTMLAARLTPILAGSVLEIPDHLLVYPPYAVHGLTGWLMIGLLGMHIGAAGLHQFIKKDNLLARMWFGK